MSYYVYDVDGYVGDLSSVGGWNIFRKVAKELGGAVWEFAEDGYTEDPEALAKQLDKAKISGSADSTRKLLVGYARKASECLILTDGEDESEKDKSTAVRLYKEFDEDQHPRDDHGRWTDGGGGGSDKPGKPSGEGAEGKHPGEGYSREARLGADGKIYTSNVEDAVRALHEDRDVVLDQPRQVSTLLGRLAEIGKEAVAAGGKAKTYDLCRVSVANSNLFCAESKGIPRIEMPQLKGHPVPGSFADSLPRDARGEVDLSSQFRDYLVSQGHKITDSEEKASFLRATQNELNGGKVAGLVGAIHSGTLADERLFVNKDNYILDGHHRWAANVTVDAEDGKFGDIKMPIARIDMGIIELLHSANKFAEDHGLPRVGKRYKPCSGCGPAVVSLTKRRAVYLKDFDEDQHPRDDSGRFSDGGGTGGGDKPASKPAGSEWDVGKISAQWAPASPSVFNIPGKFEGAVVNAASLSASQRAKIEDQLNQLGRRLRVESDNAHGPHANQLANAMNAISFAREALDGGEEGDRGIVALAEDGTMRGGALFAPDYVDGKEVMELHYLGSFQRGAGSSLIKQVERAAAAEGLEGVHLFSTHFAEKFYKSQGYKPLPGGNFIKRVGASKYMGGKANEDEDEPLGVLAISESFASRVTPVESAKPKKGAVYLKEYDEDQHPRDEHGRWTDGGGGAAGGGKDPKDQQRRIEEHTQRYHELKGKWAQVNNELLAYMNTPHSPEVQEKMDRLKDIVKEMNTLNCDPGGPDGIGLPGGDRDVVVIGAGPGGLAAATMAGTDGLDTLVIEANQEAGGQARFSSRIENFPGFPVGVTGETLASNMHDQAERVGATVSFGRAVTGMTYDPETGIKTLTLSDKSTVTARTVIVAGGVQFNHVTFPGSEGSNVVYGDGKTLSDLSKGATALVIGGSNGAAQAALGAARDCDHVYLLSRSSISKGMSDYQVQAVRSHSKITVIENDSISSLNRENGTPVSATTKSGQTFPTRAVGIFAGSSPKTDWLPSSVTRDAQGKVGVDGNLQTSIPGVYAIGDVRQGSIGRIGAAVGDGQMASARVWNYLDSLRKKSWGLWKAARKTKRAPTLAERNRTVDKLFDVDREYPYFGQTVEPPK